jgi:hypothetical protein
MDEAYPGLLAAVRDELERGPVLQAPMRWIRRTWLSAFPPGSLAHKYLVELDELELDRQLLLDRSRAIASMNEIDQAFEVERIFLWSQVWGYGTVGYGAYRTARVMSEPDFIVRVGGVRDALIESGALRAYAALQPGGVHHMEGLGQAFATKFLHFAGFGLVPSGTPEPLVLDRLVGRALHDAEPSQFGRRAGQYWSPKDYARYLDAAGWLSSQTELAGYTPAGIELALFRRGKRG